MVWEVGAAIPVPHLDPLHRDLYPLGMRAFARRPYA